MRKILRAFTDVSVIVFSALLYVFFSLPATVHAHEKWFVEDILPGEKPLLFSEWNTINASMVLTAVFAFVAATLVHFALRPHRLMRAIRRFFGSFSAWVSPVLRVCTGALLFGGSFAGFLLAPDLSATMLPIRLTEWILGIQLMTGLFLMLGILPRVMSLLGGVLYLATLAFFPISSVISYLGLLGIFIYLVIVGDPALPKIRGGSIFPKTFVTTYLEPAQPYAMAVLRFMVGFSFLWVALTSKLLDPTHALEFMRINDINFMPALGFTGFSNEMFVMAAGLVEALVGILMICGILPRLLGAKLIILFTVSLFLFGQVELLGHLPFYAAAFALMVKGGGERWSLEAR